MSARSYALIQRKPPTVLFTVERLKISVSPAVGKVTMATTAFTTDTEGCCEVDIYVQGRSYKDVRMSVLPNLCSDVILGHEFLKLHDSIQLVFGGAEELRVCGMTTLKVTPPSPFVNLSPDCKPIATKSRRYSVAEQRFIDSEIGRMLSEEIIETSTCSFVFVMGSVSLLAYLDEKDLSTYLSSAVC